MNQRNSELGNSAGAVSKWQTGILAIAILLYAEARVCQLYADTLPTLLIVILHVVPPAIFALVHGSVLYRWKGILVFTGCCLGIGGMCEGLGLRIGFPFGSYYFTGVMGPEVFQIPILLVLAYMGIGYCSWVLSVLILGYRSKALVGIRAVLVSVLASLVMVAWDLSMEADWSTVDKAWIWRNGGAFYGVPVSNFFGWFLTSYLFYQAFAIYCGSRPLPEPLASGRFWRAPILFYGICAVGNLLILRLPMAPPVVVDATGKPWMTMDILGACALLSLVVMVPLALLAWLRLKEAESVGI